MTLLILSLSVARAAETTPTDEEAGPFSDAPHANLKHRINFFPSEPDFPPKVAKKTRLVDVPCYATVLVDADGAVTDFEVLRDARCKEKWALMVDARLKDWVFTAWLMEAKLQPFVQHYRLWFQQERNGQREVQITPQRFEARTRTIPQWPAGADDDPATLECRARVAIDAAGSPTDIQTRTCPLAVDKAVVDSLKGWRWKPLTLRGEGIATQAYLRVVKKHGGLKLYHEPEFDTSLPPMPDYPDDKPAADAVRMLPRGVVKATKKASLRMDHIRVKLEGETTCDTRVFVGEDGAVFHVGFADCPEPVHFAAYKALSQWTFPPQDEAVQLPIKITVKPEL